jgi:preprotein translocase subunit SecG
LQKKHPFFGFFKKNGLTPLPKTKKIAIFALSIGERYAMSALFWILIVVHVLVCALLVILVLLQNDKMGGLAGLGGLTAQSAFSTAGAATFIQKLTRGVALVFFVVVLGLSYLSVSQNSVQQGSLLQKQAEQGQGAVLNTDYQVPLTPAATDVPAAPAAPVTPAPTAPATPAGEAPVAPTVPEGTAP